MTTANCAGCSEPLPTPEKEHWIVWTRWRQSDISLPVSTDKVTLTETPDACCLACAKHVIETWPRAGESRTSDERIAYALTLLASHKRRAVQFVSDDGTIDIAYEFKDYLKSISDGESLQWRRCRP